MSLQPAAYEVWIDTVRTHRWIDSICYEIFESKNAVESICLNAFSSHTRFKLLDRLETDFDSHSKYVRS